MIFPLETWEKIFLFTDAVDLLRFKRVCKCWREVIDRILRQNDYWKRKCKTEIAEDAWDEIFEKLFAHDPFVNYSQEDQINNNTWVDMYKAWTNCQRMTGCNATIETLEPLPVHRPLEVITCAKVSKNLLAVGSSEGYIYFFDISDLGKHMLYRADHMEYICDIQFFKTENNIMAVSVSVNKFVKFWDLSSKKCVESIPGRLICTSYDCSYILCENMLIVQGPFSRTLYQLDLQNIIAIAADKNKIFLYSEAGIHATICPENNELENCIIHYIKPPLTHTRRYYLFKNYVMICITEYGLLGVSVNGKNWQMYNIFPILCSIPTAVLVFLNLLILGSDSGEVHIYKVKSFERLDFETMESKKITLDSGAIVSLDIAMLSAEAHLVVADRKKIHIVKVT